MAEHPLTAYRKRHELTKTALAERAGISWKRLYCIEEGKETPTAKSAKALHEATGGEVTALEILRIGGAIPFDEPAIDTAPTPEDATLPARIAAISELDAEAAHAIDDAHLDEVERDAADDLRRNATPTDTDTRGRAA